jgi:hypothetical protein
MLLAAAVALLAVVGLFGASGLGSGDAPVAVPGGFGFAFFIVLPQIGIVALGLFDWQMGRGPWILRAADVAVFVLGMLELSLGSVGVARWLAGAIALLAATGIATSILVEPPRRAGWRR